MKKFDKSMVGKKVRFVNEKAHEDCPNFYPPVGTVGEVLEEDATEYYVKWPSGSGVDKICCNDADECCWFCERPDVELVEEPVKHLTDGEVFEMLMPKLEKNFLAINWGSIRDCDSDITKAIALAYRVGYGRGQKGRPFEYQNVQKDEVKAEPKKDNLIGKKVVLTNPRSDSIYIYGCKKDDIGIICEDEENDNIVGVILNSKKKRDYFDKSELMLIVDDEIKAGDKVVFLDEKDSKEDPKFFPPVGTILECCDEGWYYTNKPWSTMGDHWKEVMNRNHDNWNKGLFYGCSKAKKVVPLC